MSHDVCMVGIPGNHDKLDYTSKSSYLDIFKDHPNFMLYDEYGCKEIVDQEIYVHLIPYFDEKSEFANQFAKVKMQPNAMNYLITHIAINGVSNNDGSVVDTAITPNSFHKFKKVFVGHYHNKQDVLSNIHYIGSIRQNNYGEDTDKGMIVIYENGFHEQIKLNSIEYHTVKIDIDKASDEEITKLCTKWGDSQNNVRFKFEGTKAKIDALDKTKFDLLDIDVKCTYNDPNVDLSYKDAVTFTGFDKESIIEEWDGFCKENLELDHKLGTEYLQKIL